MRRAQASSSTPSTTSPHYVEDLLFNVLGLKKFSIYVQDYGAPIGYRIAFKHQDAIEGIIVQNGNAYAEGIGGAFDPMKPFWANRNGGDGKAGARAATQETTIFQYTHGVKDVRRISPDCLHHGPALSRSSRQRRHPAKPAPQLPVKSRALRRLACSSSATSSRRR